MSGTELAKAGGGACGAPPAVDDLVGRVHSVLPGAAVDGPGLRYLVFMSGCAYRCLYCHNPDTWKLAGGKETRLSELIAGIASYRPFLAKGGGVTVSGGEPLMQAAFVGELFSRIKSELGLHTALDTNGSLASGLEDSWFDPIDLVLLDIKHSDEEAHRRLTGASLEPVLACARRISAMGKSLWIRHVLVPGLTDDPSVTRRIAQFAADLGRVERVDVLPFHQLGAYKWRELGLGYELEKVEPPTEERLDEAKEIFRSLGLFAP